MIHLPTQSEPDVCVRSLKQPIGLGLTGDTVFIKAMLFGTLTMLMMAATPPAGQYTIDPDATLLLVLLRPDESRLLSGLSHEHVVRATRPVGSFEFDPKDPDRCRITVSARVVDLEVDSPEMRRKVGYDDVLDEDDRESITENMLDDDQLHGGKFPSLGFVGDRCEPMVDGRIRVQGNLTVRGVSQPLQLPMTVQYRNGRLYARGEFTLTHAAFGFEPYSTALGALANDDWLKFVVEVFAKRKMPPRRAATTRTSTASKAKAAPASPKRKAKSAAPPTKTEAATSTVAGR